VLWVPKIVGGNARLEAACFGRYGAIVVASALPGTTQRTCQLGPKSLVCERVRRYDDLTDTDGLRKKPLGGD